MDRPRLKAHLIPRVVPPDRVFLVAESGHYLVHGAAAAAIVDLLDGTRTVPEIAEAVAGTVSFGEVLFAISKFQRFGHLADGDPGHDAGLAALFDSQGLEPPAAAAALAATTVEVICADGVSGADAEPVAAALTGMGCAVRSLTVDQVLDGDSAPGSLAVVLTDDYLRPELRKLDAALRADERPWILVKPVGAEIWVGPRLVPGQTGCLTCLDERLDGNRQVERYLMRELGDERGRVAASVSAAPYSRQLAAAIVAGAVTELVTTGASGYDGVLVSVHSRTLQAERHQLIRQPQCADCGDPGLLRTGPRITLDRGQVRFSDDGGYRVMPPAQTYQRLEKHVSRLLGAVSSLRLLNELDNGITYSYSAGHNFAMAGDNIAMLRRNLRGQSGGKGRTDIQARVSGMCEAIERYSGVWREARPTRRAAYNDLGADLAVHPNDVLLYSRAQYEMRAEWNQADAGRLHAIPDPFREDLPVAWTSTWSLTNERERLVPAGYCWFGHPDLREHFYCFSDGNGNASGNTLEEAVLQAFCELCERDSVALWWYNRLRHPRFDLDSLHDPYVDMLREFYAGMNRDIWVLDLTTDLGVPTYAALSRRLDHPVEDVLMGFGAHLDPRMAVSRALTELNQFLPAIINRLPDGSTDYWEDDPATLAWWQHATVAREPWLLPADGAPAHRLDDHPAPGGSDLAELVATCVERAAGAGLEMLVLDQSRPDIELKVAKVIVPGLRHFWRRLGPGRLYDVPVALGWLTAATPEADLNPLSVFF
jgi:bacteriocin biosynthesis cyclodehydratase domain-containing protein